MLKRIFFLPILFIQFVIFAQIPLPEHPRPDFQRKTFLNLNGYWDFEIDKENIGLKDHWETTKKSFAQKILVPFPWGSPLSEIENTGDIGWYHKKIQIPSEFKNQRPFLVIGASDWETSVFVNGKFIGSHQGGYLPFDFDLSPFVTAGQEADILIRVDDVRRDFTLYGKQGYGDAKGIWQTIYLESRPENFIRTFQILPNIDQEILQFTIQLDEIAKEALNVNIQIPQYSNQKIRRKINKGEQSIQFTIPFKKGKLWDLTNPFLYDLTMDLEGAKIQDQISTYFGYRKISAGFLPDNKTPYVLLNNQPIYLKLALDQSYHPKGFYTFPSDEFMRNEIAIAKEIGLNGIRTHIKIDVPRKLYWADKLGLLIMSDLPNSWGEPKGPMKVEAENTLKGMISRDFNHPSIFSWIVFNEGWGLSTNLEENGKKTRKYLPETQEWVGSMVKLAKGLDPTRLVEDNSICCDFKHVNTDIHSWHAYLPGYEWDAYLKQQADSTYPGSQWNFLPGYHQGNQPMINSEFGNVWGYNGSTGDVDITFDYHRAMNAFRNQLKIAGWLYTEHHDVINEWNGYVRFDRRPKSFGLDRVFPGMSIQDLHSDFYLSTGQTIALEKKPGELVEIPLKLSALANASGADHRLIIKKEFFGTNALGENLSHWIKSDTIHWSGWSVIDLPTEKFFAPKEKSLNTLGFTIQSLDGKILHRNFINLIVQDGSIDSKNSKSQILTKNIDQYEHAHFQEKFWKGVRGNKLNALGAGAIDYSFVVPSDLKVNDIQSIEFLAELSSRKLLGRDRVGGSKMEGDYMLGKGTNDPSKNPNAYPQTDLDLNPARVQIFVNDLFVKEINLKDDPADHAGILSWFYQAEDHQLDEAGTYGELIRIPLTKEMIESGKKYGKWTIRIVLPENSENGFAIYGDHSGRYMVNPSLKISQ